MRNKCIFIILDGLTRDIAIEQLGFMNNLVEHNQATRLLGWGETPSNSRPMYEVLHTGVPSYKNGVTTNMIVRNSKEENIFSKVKANGGVTGAAAYHWMSELYNEAPFNPLEHRIQFDSKGLIDHGIFYSEDDYPDSHLFMDAHYILTQKNPDYMLVHSMNIDHIGHTYGSDSKEYRAYANRADTILGTILPAWQQMGYQIIVTADHGMDQWGLHGGTSYAQRATAMFVLSDKIKTGFLDKEIPHLDVAPFLEFLLELASAPESVKEIVVEPS